MAKKIHSCYGCSQLVIKRRIFLDSSTTGKDRFFYCHHPDIKKEHYDGKEITTNPFPDWCPLEDDERGL